MPANSLLLPPAPRIQTPTELRPLSVGLRDAARLIGVSERHLQKLAIAGQVPSAMIGNRRVFRIATLDAWLASHEWNNSVHPLGDRKSCL
jgi:excisionase family DNA binding protein